MNTRNILFKRYWIIPKRHNVDYWVLGLFFSSKVSLIVLSYFCNSFVIIFLNVSANNVEVHIIKS